MLDRKPDPMSVTAFFAWAETQSERYELVGGAPVPVMAGVRNVLHPADDPAAGG